MEKTKWIFFSRSERGYFKRRNEDFIFFDDTRFKTSDENLAPVWIVADGMGGNINSNLAVKEVVDCFVDSYIAVDAANSIEERLKKALALSQKHLQQKTKEWNTPGLTISLIIAVVNQGKTFIVNLGRGLALISLVHEEKTSKTLVVSSDDPPMDDEQYREPKIYVFEGLSKRLLLLSDGFLAFFKKDTFEEAFTKYQHKALLDKLFNIAEPEKSEDNLSALFIESEKVTSKKVNKVLISFILLAGILVAIYFAYPFIQRIWDKISFRETPISFTKTEPEAITERIYHSETSENKQTIELPPEDPKLSPPIESNESDRNEVPPSPPPLPLPPSSPSVPVARPIPSSPPPTSPSTPKYQRVKVVFDSMPAGAQIFINGKYYGLSPASYELAVGSYTLLFSKPPLYAESSRNLIITGNNSEEKIFFELKQAYYSIELISNPPEAKIYINGNFEGLTPRILLLKPGEWQLTLSKPGFEEYNDTLIIHDTQNPSLIKKPIISLIPSKPEQTYFWNILEAV